MAAVLDHIVINARARMDRAQDIFDGLGFCLTPRGHHTLGSINHLMMFEQDYLEILGVPKDDATIRPDLYSSPFGLNGLVFKTQDVDEAFERLQASGMAGDPPRSFSRPLVLDDGTEAEAAFRTVTARADAFPAGRLYFCEHLTPDLVWRKEWLTHPGGITGFTELVIVAPDPKKVAAQMGQLLEIEPRSLGEEVSDLPFSSGFRLTVMTADAYLARLGANARVSPGRDTWFGALGLRCTSKAQIEKNASELDGVSVSNAGTSLALTLAELDTLLLFDI